jgi:hypothetical protein
MRRPGRGAMAGIPRVETIHASWAGVWTPAALGARPQVQKHRSVVSYPTSRQGGGMVRAAGAQPGACQSQWFAGKRRDHGGLGSRFTPPSPDW